MVGDHHIADLRLNHSAKVSDWLLCNSSPYMFEQRTLGRFNRERQVANPKISSSNISLSNDLVESILVCQATLIIHPDIFRDT